MSNGEARRGAQFDGISHKYSNWDMVVGYLLEGSKEKPEVKCRSTRRKTYPFKGYWVHSDGFAIFQSMLLKNSEVLLHV